jgi:hypothetical protein
MRKKVYSCSLKEESFANLVQQTLNRWHVPGMAIAVVDGDHTWAEVRDSLYDQI